MSKINAPKILLDTDRLPEIYLLRTSSWENSPGRADINSNRFPNGYSDSLDEVSIHFIATTETDEIIAAARLTLCNRISDLPYAHIFDQYLHCLPHNEPFVFYSRLVIHHRYRKMGLREQFDTIRMQTQQQLSVSFGLVTVNPKRQRQLKPYGFQLLGDAIDSTGRFPFNDLGIMLITQPEIKPENNLVDQDEAETLVY